MEGWFPRNSGERTCLRIAEAAERSSELDGRITGHLPTDPPAGLPQTRDEQGQTSERRALPSAGIDAGRKIVAVTGELSLDILLHGRKNKAPFWFLVVYRGSRRFR
jgi:hypothetical protein